MGLRNMRGHGRNFGEVQSKNEHGQRGDASPAVQVPPCPDEIYFGHQSQLQNRARFALVKLLRQFQDGVRAPVFTVRGAPDGDVDRLLLDLVADQHDTEKCTRRTRADIDSLAVAALAEERALRNKIE